MKQSVYIYYKRENMDIIEKITKVVLEFAYYTKI